MDPLANLRTSFEELERRTVSAIRTHTGDATMLGQQRNEVLRFLEAVEINRHLFPLAELITVQQNIRQFTNMLDAAVHLSNDPPDDSPVIEVATRVRTGRRGRPRIEIDSTYMRDSMDSAGPKGKGHIARTSRCSVRTVTRRLVDCGYALPGEAVYVTHRDPDGDPQRIYRGAGRPPITSLTSAELDELVHSTLLIFPEFGWRKIAGHLRSQRHHVPEVQIRGSYIRVHGAPGLFGDRSLHRKRYHVAGANSLWHHDGQHGLIRYKMVIHGFTDGKSRLVTGIKVNNNNTAASVLALFLNARSKHGTPSRMRGDHGTENFEVAQWMLDNNGPGRGSYIFGRSVHNTRIERLWYEVTHDFGMKWKNFLLDLEVHHGLNPKNSNHIWLIHHLWLDAVNEDAQEWAEVWNNHKMNLPRSAPRTPREMFITSMILDGPRGIDDILQDWDAYGIDWEATEDARIREHVLVQNPMEWDSTNPFSGAPAHTSHVPCDAPPCPLSSDSLNILQEALAERVDLSSRIMEVRRLVWQEALSLCEYLFQMQDTESASNGDSGDEET